jgi:hypothetical protein
MKSTAATAMVGGEIQQSPKKGMTETAMATARITMSMPMPMSAHQQQQQGGHTRDVPCYECWW